MFSNKNLEKTIATHTTDIEDLKKIRDEIATLKSAQVTENDGLVDRIKKIEDKLNPFIDVESKMQGPEPFIAVISESFHAEHGIELKLDWNDAMINFLKRNGYAGVDDEQIIQQYVYDLFSDKIKEIRT